MPNRIAVPSSDFIRNVGRWQNEALRQPIFITHHGRDRLVLAAPEEFHGASADVSDKEAQKQLFALKACCESLVENLDCALLAVDEQLTILNANQACAALIGAARDDLRGASLLQAFPELFARIVADHVQRVLRTSQEDVLVTSALKGLDLKLRIFTSPQGAVVLIQNITEMRRLSSEVEEMRALQAALDSDQDVALVRVDTNGRIRFADEHFARRSGFASTDLIGHRLTEVVAAADRSEVALMLERLIEKQRPERVRFRVLARRGETLHCDVGAAPILHDFLPRGATLLFKIAAATE